jgi:hypothetical protein
MKMFSHPGVYSVTNVLQNFSLNKPVAIFSVKPKPTFQSDILHIQNKCITQL